MDQYLIEGIDSTDVSFFVKQLYPYCSLVSFELTSISYNKRERNSTLIMKWSNRYGSNHTSKYKPTSSGRNESVDLYWSIK